MGKARLSRCSMMFLIVAGTLVCLHGAGSSAAAQSLRGILDTLSPLVTMPTVQGEVQLRPIWMKVTSGHNSIPSLGLSWDLRDDFGLVDPALVLDLMFRLQVGRLGFRLQSNMADFTGQRRFMNQPGQLIGGARLEYSGIRLGWDVDILRWGRSRAGVDVDYDYFPARFTESIETPGGGKKIIGKEALTIGVHASFVPGYNLWGISPVFEVRARRPLAGAVVSEVEIAAGLIGPETVLGVTGIRGGFRRTSISFKADQFYNSVEVKSEFDATLEGVFGELVYYY